MTKTLIVKNRDEWRVWLEKSHDSEKEVWLVCYKKKTSQISIPYEEALCWGWIDSIIQKIDDEKYGRKFTPRKSNSQWSALKKRRTAEMIRKGRMTAKGFAKRDFNGVEDDYGRMPERKAEETILPEFLRQALSNNPPTLENFNRLAPSYRRNYIQWISAAKTEETHTKRLAEAVRLLKKNKKLDLM